MIIGSGVTIQSGVNTTSQSVDNIDYLLVGGGGAGGISYGGGGGGGGVLAGSTPISANTPYEILVGAGGTGQASSSNGEYIGTQGNNTSINPNWAGSFNGTSDYLTIPSSTALAFGTGDFTVEAWINPITVDAGQNQFCIIAVGSPYIQLFVSGGTLYYNDGSQAGGGTIVINQWQHVAVTRIGTSVTCYINGISCISTTSSVNFAAATTLIGTNQASGGTRTWGYISNLRVVKGLAVYTSDFTPPSQTLTTTQVANTNGYPSAAISGQTSLLTLQNSTFIDNANNFVITQYGFPTLVPNLSTAWSSYFNGTDQYLTISSATAFNMSTGNFTVEGWIYLTSYTTGIVTNGQLFGTVLGSPNGYYLNPGQDINSLRVTSNASGSWQDDITVTTGNGIPLNTWTHVAMVRNGSSLVLYKNGVNVASRNDVSAWNFTSPNNQGYIGIVNDGGGPTYVNGYISNVRVTKGLALYTSTFTPSTKSLTPTQLTNVNGFPSAPILGTQTSLLTLQNSTIIDNSTNAFTITNTGTVTTNTNMSPFNLTAFGGGQGSPEGGSGAAGSGGSGGGSNYTGSAAIGYGIIGQGYNGGAGDTTNLNYGGGGGGAGQVGYAGTDGTHPGQGGNGIASSITGTSTYYGGGGGGWYRYGTTSGGLGGGGNSAYSTNGIDGSPNTGGGGGATSGRDVGGFNSGNGGSGIAIIRYSNIYPPAFTTGSPTYTETGGYRIYQYTGTGTFLVGSLPAPVTIDYLNASNVVTSSQAVFSPGTYPVVVTSGNVGVRYPIQYAAATTYTNATYSVANGYRVYTFTSTGTISWNQPGSNPPMIEYLSVAGGGGGGGGDVAGGAGGGGGAGGFLTGTSQVLDSESITITVGAGGAASTGVYVTGSNGGNSTLVSSSVSILSYGGGGGASDQSGSGPTYKTGASGGSGGGTAINNFTGTIGLGVVGQGTNGSWGDGAGGGGAGQAGQCDQGGGNGLQSNITGTLTYYAGGGGGYGRYAVEPGGLGGGGNGSYATDYGSPGVVNTGGGGGGGNALGGAAGGSGIIIIRYPNSYNEATLYSGATYANSGGYRIYTFTSSGAITWQPVIPVDYIVVAGGASGGGYYWSGGGGAGGYRSSVSGEMSGGGTSAESQMAAKSGTTYTITVGAGGAAVSGEETRGNNGGNSSIIGGTVSITSLGGGAGGPNSATPNVGGSGGGSAEPTTPGAAGTAGQGYAGGTGSVHYAGAGGGGAGAAALNTSISNTPTDGGVGVQSNITGTLTYYAGGGAGSTGSSVGGLGGGGNGSGASPGRDGTTNTGGGGGGGSSTGGSGIVILRYPSSYTAASATTGSPTITTSGGYRIYTWTSSGSITF